MSTINLHCGKCCKPTPHRAPPTEKVEGGSRYQAMQCEICGTIASAPPGGHHDAFRQDSDVSEDGSPSIDAAGLLARLPYLSPKEARARLEELLYERRSGVEDAEAFCRAAASANASNFEMQDIKVRDHRRERDIVIVDFTFYALGESADEDADGSSRIDGAAVGHISDVGMVEISDVTAAVSSG
jgi:hypothetical protein